MDQKYCILQNNWVRNAISDNMQSKSVFVLHTECQWDILNFKARNRTGWKQRVLLMSRACSLRHNLLPAPLPFLLLEPLKKAALSAVSTPVHAGLWAPGSTSLPGTPKLCCKLKSWTAPPGLELKRKVRDSRWFQNKPTQTLQKTERRAQVGWALLGWHGAI